MDFEAILKKCTHNIKSIKACLKVSPENKNTLLRDAIVLNVLELHENMYQIIDIKYKESEFSGNYTISIESYLNYINYNRPKDTIILFDSLVNSYKQANISEKYTIKDKIIDNAKILSEIDLEILNADIKKSNKDSLVIEIWKNIISETTIKEYKYLNAVNRVLVYHLSDTPQSEKDEVINNLKIKLTTYIFENGKNNWIDLVNELIIYLSK